MMSLTTDGIQSQWEEPVREEKDACKESLVGGRLWDATEEDVLLANETFAPLGADERVKFPSKACHVLSVFGHPLPKQDDVFDHGRHPVPVGRACAREGKTDESRTPTPQTSNIVNVRGGWTDCTRALDSNECGGGGFSVCNGSSDTVPRLPSRIVWCL